MADFYFDYTNEPREDILCIDMKSFYASVECRSRGLDPLETMLVVMSNSEQDGGLVLAASPKAKKVLGISNVTRKYEIPYHKDLIIVPPRMNLYIEMNMKINSILRKYVADQDILIYSIDESFVRVTSSKKLFNLSAYGFAETIKNDILNQTGLYCTIGIGDNMLLSKLALDNEAKKNKDMIATWRYEDVQDKVWNIPNLTDFWGINKRTERNLNMRGIRSVRDLAHYNYFVLKESMGVIGEQLIAHAWGIDRTRIDEKYVPKSLSIGNSQILKRDYVNTNEIKIVLREISEQVATRIRTKGLSAGCLHLTVGYSRNEINRGFSRQTKIVPTNNSKELTRHCLTLFDKFYDGSAVRSLGISYSKFQDSQAFQLSLFENPSKQITNHILDETIDLIRQRYGFTSIVRASSHLEGATAISRSNLVGGHAGGMDGLR
ncbi:Y-family DNA polymerase [Enterococcus mundtii]|uniref:Y-family DNA polymerase n=1 Tax=Enterococcus mundtii TaxID=53346 RepID=UPI001A970788|nr:Y-family DNA polymerase [Enterococcus mundtii]